MAGACDVVVLEAGRVGEGDSSVRKAPSRPATSAADEDAWAPGISGTQVMAGTRAIKMAITVYPATSKDFVRHHGEVGAKQYLRLAAMGLELQKTLAGKLLPRPATQLRCLGSLYVADAASSAELREEYALLKRFGADVELWEKERVTAAHGSAAGFTVGIFFPQDAVIDSPAYARALLAAAEATGRVRLYQQCGVVATSDVCSSNHDNGGSGALVTLVGGARIHCQFAVLATGGLHMDENLAGILTPAWSYLIGLPADQRLLPSEDAGMACPNSPNFFTWGFTHDWCIVDGKLRVSGEDHFSALKPPRVAARCDSLLQWSLEKYPYLRRQPPTAAPTAPNAAPTSTQDLDDKLETAYGVYSETPDALPLVGKPHPSSALCYLVGCNAWGQSSMSFCASLVPGLLGFSPLTPEQQQLAAFVSITRFARFRPRL